MFTATTLTGLIEANRSAARSITYLEGEQNERTVPFGELYERALGILYHLQKLGAKRGGKRCRTVDRRLEPILGRRDADEHSANLFQRHGVSVSREPIAAGPTLAEFATSDVMRNS